MNTKLNYLKWRSLKLTRQIRYALYKKLYRDTDPDIRKNIFVAGTARSGTTWLSNIIASQLPCRLMFEPFHSTKVNAFNQFHYFHYMRPGEDNQELWSFCQRIFTGKIRDGWIDRRVERIFPSHRLIKDIRANLFLKWLHNTFPQIPLLFIMRHPCAVVLSRMKLDWATDTDIESFLVQTKLVDDFLTDKLDFILQAKTIEEKHTIIWCINNMVPIKQFGLDGLNIIFYENLVRRPEAEIGKISQVINIDFNRRVHEQFSQPSTTATWLSSILTGRDIISHWQTELSTKQINNILATVKLFELDYLYNNSTKPLIEV